MKIKTIRKQLDYAAQFDAEVNAALEDGWRLIKRDILAGYPLTATEYANRMLYAELVKMDEEPADPEPLPLDPLAPARSIQAYCNTVTGEDCQGDRCPLAAFCDQLQRGKRPDEWELPEEERHGTNAKA